jgi:PKHD-type hydroxylase
MPRQSVTPLPPSGSGSGKSLQFWSIFANAFSAVECAELSDLFAGLDAVNGGLVAGRFNQKVRQSSLVWLPESEDLAWVGARMARLAADANRELFGFALDGLDEQLQLAVYGPGHYYDWHIDRGRGSIAGRRKLTLSVQLTAPDLYDGGAFEINADGYPYQVSREQGTAVVIAATTLHRVEPVVRGFRYSLVTWTHGPAFV